MGAGAKDGQTRIVREGDSGVAYSWNAKEYKWDKVKNCIGFYCLLLLLWCDEDGKLRGMKLKCNISTFRPHHFTFMPLNFHYVLEVLHMFTNLSDLSKALEVSDHAVLL
jgi:hypothetical protein